jgi:hypothetical protein
MTPVVSQIERVGSVRPSAGNAEELRPALGATRPNGSSEAAKNVARDAEPRPAPVADHHGIRLTVNTNTHEVLATLVNTTTNEVIRTIPGEGTRRAGEVIRGITGQLLDKLA